MNEQTPNHPPRHPLSIAMTVCLSFWLLSTSAVAQIDLVKVDKSKRQMYLMEQGQVVRSYRIALGKYPQGPKQRLGDKRTPEGRYILDRINHYSSFYKAFHINYPNERDRLQAGLSGYSPGGGIHIHGQKNGSTRSAEFMNSFDWTNGCIAISNSEMDEFIELVPVGTPIDIEW